MQSSAGVCVCVLCGLPAAGKSTVTHLLSDHLHTLGWRNFIISYDQLINPEELLNLHTLQDEEESPTEPTAWKQHRQAVLECVESFLQELSADTPHTHTAGGAGSVCGRFQEIMEQQQILTALQDTHSTALQDTHSTALQDTHSTALQDTHSTALQDTHSTALQDTHSTALRLVLLLDDNFYYHSMRHRVYQLARRLSVGFCEVFLHCPLEVCLHRNRVRGQPVSDDVINAMSNRIEPPNAAKNPWEKNSVTVDNTHTITHLQLQELLQMISSAAENPLIPVQDDTEQREADRQRCASSVLHQVDQVCRRLVSQAMMTASARAASGEEMKGLSRDLSEEKSRFLQELRSQLLQQLGRDECVCVERVVAIATDTFTHRTRVTMERRFPSPASTSCSESPHDGFINTFK